MSTQTFSRSYVIGTSALITGIFVMIASLLVRDTTLGWPTALIDRWYFTIGAVAMAVFGICARKDAARFGVLAFFLIVGGAAQLYLTDPVQAPAIRLDPQNWKEWVMYGVIGAEALAALVVIVQAGLAGVLVEADRRLGINRLMLLVLVTGFLSVPILSFVARGAGLAYAAHVLAGIVLMLAHLGIMAAMALVKSPISGLYRLTALAPATVTLCVSLTLAFMAFEVIPHNVDEVANQFQARILAGGALTAPAPPEAALPGLDYPLFTVEGGRWFAATNPGWPAVLALGEAIRAPWLINPLLAALSVLMAHAIASRLAGRDEADLVAMMMGASPWLLAMAASLMPHTLSLALMLFAWWMILRAIESPRHMARRLIGAGLAIGWLFAIRPADGLIVGGLTGLWLAFSAKGSPARAGFYAAGCAVTAALALSYNAVITGNALLQPARAYRDRLWAPNSDRLGFGPEVGPPGGNEVVDLWPGHSLGEALINTLNQLSMLGLELMGWSIGSLALILCFLLWQRPNRADLLMIVAALGIVAVNFFYWSAGGLDIGPRFWFLTVFPLFFLSARGYQAIRARFPDQDEQAFVRIDALFWYACVFGFCVFLPWRAVTKYYEDNHFHPTVLEDAADGRFAGKVVLVAPNGDKGSTLMLNDPWLRGTVFLVDTGTLDPEALAAAFPGREIVTYSNDWTGR